ncbi:MAG: putative rane protein [Verrucomicrobiales bacterium]|nr:putative rane protein [Verrucomicrobiales bacterium]
MFSKSLLLTFALLVINLTMAPLAKAGDFTASNSQLLLVTTPNWTSVSGSLRRFVRGTSDSPWRQVGAEMPIVVGRNGLGWGQGLHPTNHFSGPIKKEGDGKSPAGVFSLPSAFGLEPHTSLEFIKLPYQQLLSPIECVDDTNSIYYNQIVSRDGVKKVDWNSSEKMREIGQQYRLGVFVNHNSSPREFGGGSCIFLHIWKAAGTGTSGCTAMTSENMEVLLRWLDPAQKPILVQLPESEYQKLKGPWHLPNR